MNRENPEIDRISDMYQQRIQPENAQWIENLSEDGDRETFSSNKEVSIDERIPYGDLESLSALISRKFTRVHQFAKEQAEEDTMIQYSTFMGVEIKAETRERWRETEILDEETETAIISDRRDFVKFYYKKSLNSSFTKSKPFLVIW